MEQVDGNSFVLSLEDVDSINHIVVFLTGQMPFTQGFGGAVYFGWPSPESGSISWQFLGFISNEKPSAIFKIAKIKASEISNNPFSSQLIQNLVRSPTNAQIGIMVETLSEISQKSVSPDTTASQVQSFTEFSQKMLENFFNYASSFAVSPGQSPMNPATTYVPIDVLQKWYATFERRLQANPQFWRTL